MTARNHASSCSWYDDPYAREVEHLSGAIRGEHPLAWGLDDAGANTAVLEAMHASLRLRAPVTVVGRRRCRPSIPKVTVHNQPHLADAQPMQVADTLWFRVPVFFDHELAGAEGPEHL